MKILQINTTVNSGSHGRIAEAIGLIAKESGHSSYIAGAYTNQPSQSEVITIGNGIDMKWHGLKTRLLDRHGFGSVKASTELIKKVELIDPDLIHLHNIHGYYLNVRILFNYLKKSNKPVVWTFHDCWPFTGHCSHFQFVNCNRWQSECYDCPALNGYPRSWFIDNSRKNFHQKKILFTGLKNMVLVSPSKWLATHLENSFLSGYEIKVINNGVSLNKFKPTDSEAIRAKYNLDRKYILGVASIWNSKKGLLDFIKLKEILNPELDIVLVGLSNGQKRTLTNSIKGICRTENIEDLAALYSGAEVFVNPTYIDNFPSVNIEALACGTPVVTYNTGGSTEAIDSRTGIVVNKGDISGLKHAIWEFLLKGKQITSEICRERAERLYDAKLRNMDYIAVYENIVKKNIKASNFHE